MSFKREGNDVNWLRLLRKRRTDELLSENIPDGEAKLLSNGRIACLVCHFRPVFDTVAMLHVHRGGKKHALAHQQLIEKRQELKELLLKRRHSDIISKGFSSLTLPKESSAGSITAPSCSYDPRSRTNPHERKRRLRIEADDESNPTLSGLSEVKTYKVKQLSRLKTMFAPPISHEPLQVNPYIRKRHSDSSAQFVGRTCSVSSFDLPQTEVLNTPSTTVPDSFNGLRNEKRSVNNDKIYKSKLEQFMSKRSRSNSRECCNNSGCDPVSKHLPKSGSHSAQGSSQRYDAEYDLRMRESGWLRNNSGQWVKDKNCEFDSEDEGDE